MSGEPGKKEEAARLEEVLQREHAAIRLIRRRRNRNCPGTVVGKSGGRNPENPPEIPNPCNRAKPVTDWTSKETRWVRTVARAHKENLVGLAFSGGGIRSATFNLGVLQALAELRLLSRIDYLSTVSGGGYIGGWLAAWVKRIGSFATVQNRLATNRVLQPEDKEPPEIRFLRVFSNYLTPLIGLFSGDTWAMVAIYLRNTLLNQVVVVAMVAGVLTAPRWAVRFVVWAKLHPVWEYALLGMAGAGLLLAFTLIAANMSYLDNQGKYARGQLTRTGWILIFVAMPLFFAALVLGGHLATRAIPNAAGGSAPPRPQCMWENGNSESQCPPDRPGEMSLGGTAALGGAAYAVIWIIVLLPGRLFERGPAKALNWIVERMAKWSGRPEAAFDAWADRDEDLTPTRSKRESVIIVVSAAGAGALAGWLYALLSGMAEQWTANLAVSVAGPLVVGVFLLAGTLHLGLMGTAFPDRRREWWGRLGGWLMLWGLAWAGICWVALHSPQFFSTTGKDLAMKYLTPSWLATTLGGLLAGKSKDTGGEGGSVWKDWVARAAPYVFVVGVFCWVAWGIDWIQRERIWCTYEKAAIPAWSAGGTPAGCVMIFLACLAKQAGALLHLVSNYRLPAFTVVCVGVTLVVSWRVDINQFSMNLFYKNRLVRCFLGASNPNRAPNRFTGFDADDDLGLHELSPGAEGGYDGPYLVINATMNLTRGKELAWQERMAESFVMTPEFCGYDVWLEEQDSPLIAGLRKKLYEPGKAKGTHATAGGAAGAQAGGAAGDATKTPVDTAKLKMDRFGYRPTEEYAYPPNPKGGVRLGTAMAISGAAANPNMGYHSSTPVAFLMTLFNVRLGQWLGNPRHRKTWTKSSPELGLPYLFNDLLAGADDDARFVELSDGGHFENLGIYELVKRRCGLIIACDAEADGDYVFGGLGTAIRNCRIDMGIDIEMDITEIAPTEAGKPSKRHCAVGTIHYERVDPDAPAGTIVYFKSSLTCDESTDIKNYKKGHPEFPHESTADQWFTESQFESYRALGYHVVRSSIMGQEGEYGAGTEGCPTPPAEGTKLRRVLKEFKFDMSEIAPEA